MNQKFKDTETNIEDSMNFLEEFFFGKPEGHFINIWTSGNKKSEFISEPSEIAQAVQTLTNGMNYDIYFGVCTSTKNLPSYKRFASDGIEAVYGLWIDIDIKDEVHQKSNLPPDSEAALALISEAPLDPTIIVDSGHGFHAYWLFKEPYVISSPENREKISTLERSWNDLIAKKAEVHGWVIDSVYDLARIMRLPGTYNTKSKEPIYCEIHKLNDTMYEPEDFEQFITPGGLSSFTKNNSITTLEMQSQNLPDMNITEDSTLTAEELELIQQTSKLKKTFEHKRGNELKDNSLSAYDFSIALQLLQSGWKDEDIARALIYHRRKHNGDLKLNRSQCYYSLTINKAKNYLSLENTEIPKTKEQFIEQGTEETKTQEKLNEVELAQEKKRDLEILNEAVQGVTIVGVTRGIYKNKSDQSTKILDPNDIECAIIIEESEHPIELGKPTQFSNSILFLRKISQVTKRKTAINPLYQKQWRKLEMIIYSIAEDIRLGSDASRPMIFFNWLETYINESNTIHATFDIPTGDVEIDKRIEECPVSTQPFPFSPVLTKNSIYLIHIPSLKEYIRNCGGSYFSEKELAKHFRSFGCGYVTIRWKKRGKLDNKMSAVRFRSWEGKDV